jgi:hypothetical protein
MLVIVQRQVVPVEWQQMKIGSVDKDLETLKHSFKTIWMICTSSYITRAYVQAPFFKYIMEPPIAYITSGGKTCCHNAACKTSHCFPILL